MFGDLTYRIRAVFRRRRMESELAEELAFHFERQVDALVEQGYPPVEARRRARLLFGGLDQIKEECRDARGIALLETLWQDLRYAARLLARTPGFGAAAILSMAVGVGSIALASWLLGQVAYRSLPVEAPEQLVSLRSSDPHPGGDAGADTGLFSYPIFLDLQGRNTVFSGVLARTNLPADLTYSRQTERVSLELVSRNYFALLGVKPAAGRCFNQNDDGRPVAMLSHSYWVRRFSSDPSVVGRTILLNNLPMTIAGVSPRGLDSLIPGRSPDVLAPIEMEEIIWPTFPVLSAPGRFWIDIVGRLKPGMTRQRAQAELTPVYRQLMREAARNLLLSGSERERLASRRLELIPASRGVQHEPDWMLVSLFAIAACVLIAACTNLAGLCLARAAARQKEIAIRAALGAGRGRMARQLLIEFLLPAAVGGMLGLLIALAGAGAVPKLLFDPERARTFSAVPIADAFLFALAVSAVVALVCGAIPALLPAFGRLPRALNTGNIGPLGPGQATFRKVLVTAQVALSVGLMFGAISFSSEWLGENLRRHALGTQNEIAFQIDAGARGYNSARAARLFERLEQRLSAVPGVRGAGFWVGDFLRFEVEGRALAGVGQDRVWWLEVSPGLFNAAGFSLVAGRALGPAGEWPPRAVLVNETFERLLFGGRNALGKRVRPYGSGPWAEVVGVVRDRRPPGFGSDVAAIYSQYSGAQTVGYCVRTLQPPETLISAVKELVEREAPGMPPTDLTTMDAQYAEGDRPQRVLAAVLCAFGVLTMALAAVGVYAVTAYVVTRRTPEFGVRMALGATAASVVRMVMQEVLRMAAAGAAAGVLLTVVACALLFPPGGGPIWREVYPEFAAGAFAAAAAAVLAGFQAARRALRVGPATALRSE